MSKVSDVTRGLVVRVWNDFEPKLQAAFASGAVVTILLSVLQAYGIVLPSAVDEVLVLVAGWLAGYIKKSKVPVPAKVNTVLPPLPTADQIPAETLPSTPS